MSTSGLLLAILGFFAIATIGMTVVILSIPEVVAWYSRQMEEREKL